MILRFSSFYELWLRYHLKGPKAGQSEVWVDGLIGMPDNIYWDPRGMFVVSLYQCRGNLDLLEKLAPYPLVRRMLARSMLALETVVSLLRDVYPTLFLKNFAHLVSTQNNFCYQSYSLLVNNRSKLNWVFYLFDAD